MSCLDDDIDQKLLVRVVTTTTLGPAWGVLPGLAVERGADASVARWDGHRSETSDSAPAVSAAAAAACTCLTAAVAGRLQHQHVTCPCPHRRGMNWTGRSNYCLRYQHENMEGLNFGCPYCSYCVLVLRTDRIC